MKAPKRSYEVICYKSQTDFDNRIQEKSESGITVKREALRLGKKFLKEFPIVKIQSNDREHINLMEKYTVDYFIKKFNKIPAKEIGTLQLSNHCALWHCGVRLRSDLSYSTTDESTALIRLFSGSNSKDWRAVYRVNDGLGVKYIGLYKNIPFADRKFKAKERLLDKLKELKQVIK